MRVVIFSIEVPERERERELSEEQYVIEAAAEVAYCFELNSLSLSGTEVLKMAIPRIARINNRWGISFYVFYLLDWTSFSLNNGNPVSSTIC